MSQGSLKQLEEKLLSMWLFLGSSRSWCAGAPLLIAEPVLPLFCQRMDVRASTLQKSSDQQPVDLLSLLRQMVIARRKFS
jgi:hypothetical protein